MFKILDRPRGIKFVEFYNQNNFHVILSNYGASIYEIDMADKTGETEVITLSPQSNSYFRNSKFLGLTVGRVAGRIKDGKFKINDVDYYINPNEKGNLLHSGDDTISYRFYDIEVKELDDETDVIFSTFVKDMEDGFPGDLDLRVIYRLKKFSDEIILEYKAISSKDTFMSLTNHSYFNLSGNLKNTIDNQILTINKNYISKQGDDLILLYNEPVSKEFDFRKGMKIGKYFKSDSVKFPTNGYDHCYTDKKPLYLSLYDEKSGRFMEIESNYYDVQIYTNNYITDTFYITGNQDQEHMGIAIEPSRETMIMSKNGPLLKSNQLYDYFIKYKFSIKED